MLSLRKQDRLLLLGWLYGIVMSRYLAGLCFLLAMVLVYRGISSADPSLDSVQEETAARYESGDVRSTVRSSRGMRAREVTEKERKVASEALLAATRVEKEDGQGIIWSEENYQRHLAKLTPEDAKSLLEVIFDQKVKAVYLNQRAFMVAQLDQLNRNAWGASAPPSAIKVQPLQTNLSKVVAGLVTIMAKEDFMETTKWLDSLDSLKKDRALAHTAFDHALLAGADQNPREAWRIYQEKCPVWGG